MHVQDFCCLSVSSVLLVLPSLRPFFALLVSSLGIWRAVNNLLQLLAINISCKHSFLYDSSLTLGAHAQRGLL